MKRKMGSCCDGLVRAALRALEAEGERHGNSHRGRGRAAEHGHHLDQLTDSIELLR
jgi:hypothetical protein